VERERERDIELIFVQEGQTGWGSVPTLWIHL